MTSAAWSRAAPCDPCTGDRPGADERCPPPLARFRDPERQRRRVECRATAKTEAASSLAHLGDDNTGWLQLTLDRALAEGFKGVKVDSGRLGATFYTERQSLRARRFSPRLQRRTSDGASA